MNRRTTLALGVGLLLLVPAVAMGAIVGNPDLSATLSDNRVTAGEQTTLGVVILNEGDVESGSATNPQLDSQVTTARGLTVEMRSGDAPISVHTPPQGVGTLPTGATQPIPFTVTVDENAAPGTYDVPVEVNYSFTRSVSEGSGEREIRTTNKTFNVTVRVEDVARFEIVDVNASTRVGARGPVEVTVENVGTERARDATVTLTSQSGDVTFGQSASASRYTGTWGVGERRTFEFQARTAASADVQAYPLQLSTAFEDDAGRQRQSEALSFEVQPDPEQSFSVVEAGGSVPVDGSGEYELTLRNDGPVTVSDATVTLTARSADVTFGQSASATRYVGQWAPGEERTLTFDARASANAEQRDYALSTTISYEDPDGDPGSVEGLSIGLRPGPELEFAIEGVSSTLRVGDEGQLQGDLVNEGDAPVENVVLRWASESRTVSPSETEYAIGSLGPGERASFSFDVAVTESAESGPRQFSLVAEYRDSEGDLRQSDQLDVRQTVAEARDVFDVRVVNATVTAGEGRTIEIEVTNAGEETLTDISAKLFAESPISTTDSEAFVSELEPGESRTLRFGIAAGGGALEKDYPISIDFQYEEPDGDTPTSDTYRLPVSVREPDSSGGGLPLPLIGAAIVIVVFGYGGYRYYQGRQQ